LGVSPDASPEQIRSAYRALVTLFHPDRLRQVRPEVRAFAEERLKTLNQAYEIVGDPDRRAAYDRQAGVGRRPVRFDRHRPRASHGGQAAALLLDLSRTLGYSPRHLPPPTGRSVSGYRPSSQRAGFPASLAGERRRQPGRGAARAVFGRDFGG
jgi:curved DNA-binding protein CbpA